MKITFSATNPCHMWPLARATAAAGASVVFHSGYPAQKLVGADGCTVRAHSIRTMIVYGLLKFAPRWLRPPSRRLFAWQDAGFDRATARALEACDFLHAMPGQALETFRAAKAIGIRTVLNHATGPVRDWVAIMRPEYERAGLRLEDHCRFDRDYFAREDEEYALADYHCAASRIVRDQLIARKIPADRTWLVPYGADTGAPVFHRGENRDSSTRFRLLFAGQLSLRKGIRTLLDALTRCAAHPDWEIDFVGAREPECAPDLDAYRGAIPLRFHGPRPQAELAERMRAASVLVLPSLEEGFGLVVPQALNCGCPCIVSDRTGAKDLIRHRENGSIVPVQDAAALAAELEWWAANPRRVIERHGWEEPARELIRVSREALAGRET